MLNSKERIDGMITYLARTHPENFKRIGKSWKMLQKGASLNTAQTIALARLGRLNNVCMKKMKSYL
jgi:hypothetical protein